VTGQLRAGDARPAWADVTHAHEVLGWSPRLSSREGIHPPAAWIDAQEKIRAL